MPSMLNFDAAAAGKFGIGQPVKRKEHPTLLTGRDRYTMVNDFDGGAGCARRSVTKLMEQPNGPCKRSVR